MFDQKVTVPQFHRGRKCMGVAGPRRTQAAAATTTSTAPKPQAAPPPTFSSHFPMCMPTRLVPSATQMATSDTASKAARLSPQWAPGGDHRVEPYAHVEHGGAGKPEGDADPVDPERQKAVPGAEIVARPHVQAAGAGMLHDERRHGNGQRYHQQQRAQQPQGDRARTGVRRGRQPARADDAGDGEKRQVAKTQFAAELAHR